MPGECIRDSSDYDRIDGNFLTEERSPVKNYTEPRLELLKQWEVNIRVLTVGCIINVGCKSFAFSTIEEGLKELQDYYKDPSAARAKWSEIENKLNHVN